MKDAHSIKNLLSIGVDSESACRVRLKTATQAVPFLKSVVLLPSLSDARYVLEQPGPDIDIVFLSERLAHEELLTFAKHAKENARAQDSAFILLLSGTTKDDSTKAAQSLLSGFDGCLAEPYSIDSVTEICQLSTRLKRERRETREKAAITFLLRDVMKQLDRLAYVKSANIDVGDTIKRLKEACVTFTSFDGESMQRYHEIATELFELAQPAAPGGANYRGVSRRIKQKMATRMVDQLAREMPGGPPKSEK